MQLQLIASVAGGAAQVNVTADTVEEFQIAMEHLRNTGLLVYGATDAAPAAVTATQTDTVAGTKRTRKAPEPKAEPQAEQAAPKEEPKAEPESAPPKAVTREDIAAAVTAYGKALQAAGKTEAEAVAAIKGTLYKQFEIARAGDLDLAQGEEFLDAVKELTAAIKPASAEALL